MTDDPKRSARHLLIALAAVSAAHALSPLLLRGLHTGLGFDETVYVSQIDPHVPAGLFSAPRARGLTLLTAPASLISSSLALLRIWLSVVSGVGMFLAFLPWLRLRRSYVVPIAAFLWSGLWVATYYSFEAMPNQYVAYGALAATGWLLLAARDPDRRRLPWYAAGAIAFTALMRPSDTVFVVVPLVIAVAAQRSRPWRWRARAAGLLGLGFVAGLAEWIIEAYTRFGGPMERLHAASAENTGGLHFSVLAEMRVLAGPILCRGTCQASAPLYDRLWWFALPVLVGLGVWVAWRQRRATPYVLASVVGASIAAEYIFAIAYGAPRFLEPVYALLLLPAAEAIVWLWRRALAIGRPIAVSAAVVAVLFQFGTQVQMLARADHDEDVKSARADVVADYIAAADADQPCWVGGAEAGQIAFMAHCHVLPQSVTSGKATVIVFASPAPKDAADVQPR